MKIAQASNLLGTRPTFREGQAGHTCGDSFLCDASNLSNNKEIVNQLALGDVTVHSVLTVVRGAGLLPEYFYGMRVTAFIDSTWNFKSATIPTTSTLLDVFNGRVP